jgi:hypothetical protein
LEETGETAASRATADVPMSQVTTDAVEAVQAGHARSRYPAGSLERQTSSLFGRGRN